MTRRVIGTFGIRLDHSGETFTIPGGQRYRSPGALRAEGDWSNAAFWLCAGALGERPVTVTGLDRASAQGDRAIVDILSAFGASVQVQGDGVTVSGGDLRGICVDAREIPDLVPVLAVVAAAAQGRTEIVGAKRLRLKESDRLRTTAALVTAFGGEAMLTEDGLVIDGGRVLHGASISSFGDHRIAMAAAVMAVACRMRVEILEAQACAKSYPGFFEHFTSLGGEMEVC